jgi:hypothetical protein
MFLRKQKHSGCAQATKAKEFFSIKKYRYHSLLQTEGRIKENKTECTKD